MSTTGAPSVRTGDWPTWTGNEVLFWGGSSCGSLSSQRDVYGDGAAYNPTTDTWRSISTDGAPSPRDGYAQVWTGKELIIWSGDGSGAPDASDYDLRDDGYAYNPTTDTWRKISNEGAPKASAFVMRAWTGTEMLLWGGTPNETMAAYNPETDSWRKLSAAGPHLDRSSCSTWTGKYWVICGDPTISEDGAIYDPVADVWHPIVAGPSKDMTGMRGYPYAGDMIVIGGDGASGMHGSDLELYRFVTPD
jgi:N-acetylneuraminic acid mutarotase